jgi:Arc/MetJ-type ribon-helix-helix transcriptional regulator
VNLGAPYEAIIDKLIKREYAGNRTEAIRQALVAYDHMLEEEEARLVRQKVEEMMEEIDSGRMKTYPLEEVRERQARKRGL